MTCFFRTDLPRSVFVLDFMLLVVGALAPVRGLGGVAYTATDPGSGGFVRVSTRRKPPPPNTFVDFDVRFGVLYEAGGHANLSTLFSVFRPVGVLDALRGFYVRPHFWRT
ncbi:hypothetical protein TraAM80_03757 [Trypanosoma rangeli]|uniref:Uncharacterized protein n=1 Tax=Trypanosoma rangeli TaxID=5698 RepID=A0A3R7RLX0_TRYRA|nr:uncharacterized protein TraAM80_03757 [Trypanosoma rangeli]RNF06734.1 hypothetical protein TraAM80_03757 [Trypanosoma rangeli]|eukprot:RNF06734.1 hypothetical protein TraAM80_03757 [Trypanosoma rangeli]